MQTTIDVLAPPVTPRAVVDVRPAPGPMGWPGWRYVTQATCCAEVWVGWAVTRSGAHSRGLREYVRHRRVDHGLRPRVGARRWVLQRLYGAVTAEAAGRR